MSEAILKALMQLFALIVDIDEVQEISEKEKEIIRSFLNRQLSNELVDRYMKVFEEFLHMYHADHVDKSSAKGKKRTSLTAVRILSICEKINEELEQRQKVWVIIQMIEYIAYGIEIRETELDFLQTVASAFNILEEEYQDILHFVAFSLKDIPNRHSVLLINNEKKPSVEGIHHISNQNLHGEISFLSVPSVNSYILRYHGKDDLLLNGQHINTGITYTFDHGSSIRGQNIDPIYYTDVAGTFSTSTITSRITFEARNVEFRFKNSENGLQEFNLREESGKLIGIMGGSGVGKSTLLNVLNGQLQPQKGEILINGYNLYHEKEKEKLNGVIGFIPQDDLLMEELTVFQNLYYNAKLCLDQLDDDQVKEIVNQVLIDLDLYEIRDLKVGKPLNKVISGGQRKRVNIGLELIREPSVLFVDEPTSGLSSVDSEMVMNLLKEQVYKGKLVIINIHQPSSDLYKMFDRIIFLDKGGYQIYCGNPSEAVVYFKTKSNHANAREDQCICCGNVDPDQVLQIIEAKIVNEHGKLSRTRKVSPKEWFEHFRNTREANWTKRSEKEDLPENFYSIPGLFRQMKIFFMRDILSKLTNKQYVLISLLEAPLLAVILGYFTKYFSGDTDNPGAYVFYNNENLPAFLLMSVIVFLFLGLTISSEEIIKDRKILQRESFLNLSRFSYLNSKVLILFSISAIQAISYVLIGNAIFEIKGMTFSFWLILFTTSCAANMMGLNISSGLNSVITIYILVPFLLIPQILLSGVLVKFDRLHKSMTKNEYVPVIADVMTSRWAFEALVVNQFKNNEYQKEFYELEKNRSNANYMVVYLIPELETKINGVYQNILLGTVSKEDAANLKMVQEQVQKLNTDFGHLAPEDRIHWDVSSFDSTDIASLKSYFDQVKKHQRKERNKYIRAIESHNKRLIEEKGGADQFTEFRNRYENEKLRDMLLNDKIVKQVAEENGHLVRKSHPIYVEPSSKFGRAQLYAPEKRIGNFSIDTMWFNLLFIWFTTLILYLTLYYDLLRRVITYFENVKLRKQS